MSKLPYTFYKTANTPFARKNRKTPTETEGLVRYCILKHRPFGYKFLRQKPIGPFIPDFYCSKLLLVIEIDGSSHDDKQEYDAMRTEYLHSLGITVIRFTNYDVKRNLDGVRFAIDQEILKRREELALR